MAEKQYPEPTCGALIFNPEGRVFLMKSHKWKNKYVSPGGHVELGEKFEEALKREVKEETGLDIYDIEFICFHEFIFDEAYWKKKHFICFEFACKTKSKKARLNSEGQEYIWADLDKALKLPVEPYTMKTIREYMKLHKSKQVS